MDPHGDAVKKTELGSEPEQEEDVRRIEAVTEAGRQSTMVERMGNAMFTAIMGWGGTRFR